MINEKKKQLTTMNHQEELEKRLELVEETNKELICEQKNIKNSLITMYNETNQARDAIDKVIKIINNKTDDINKTAEHHNEIFKNYNEILKLISKEFNKINEKLNSLNFYSIDKSSIKPQDSN